MELSQQGLIEIASHEGIVLAPYRDSKGIWTFGVGHTAQAGEPDPEKLPKGQELPVQDIMEVFYRDLDMFEQEVEKTLEVPVEQHEFDALVSFHYNTGAIARCDIVKCLNNDDWEGAVDGFMDYVKPPEVKERRLKEQLLFRYGVYSSNGRATAYQADENGKVLWRSASSVHLGYLLGIEDPSPQELRGGNKGPRVVALQEKLGIIADGIYGPQTVAAVKDYQQDDGLEPTGEADEETLRSLDLWVS